MFVFDRMKSTGSSLAGARLLRSCAAIAFAVGMSATVAQAADPLKVVPFLTNENDPASLDAFQSIFGDYAKDHPDVAVDVTIAGHGDIGQRLATAAAVGGEMAVTQVTDRDLGDLVSANLLMPIDDVVEAIGAENFAPGSIYRGLDGKAYAVAFTGSSFSTLWIRDDMFKEAGLPKPTNYEELLNAAKTLTVDNNGDGRPDVYGFGIPGGADAATDFRFASFVYQQCGDFYDWDGNVAFDRPEVLEAIKRYLTLFEYSPLGAVGWSWLDGIDAFTGGRIAMHPYGGRLGVNLNRTVPDIREKTSVIPLRTGPVNAGSGGWDYVAIYAKTRYPDVAKDVLKYFLSPDQLQKFSLTVPGHLVPPIKSVKESLLKSDNEYVQKYNSDVATLLDIGSSLVASPSMNMGAIDPGSCTFNPLPNPAPWASEVFSGKPSVISEMFQRITVDKEAPEDAWKWAYTRMGEIADKWKGEHPEWKPIPRT